MSNKITITVNKQKIDIRFGMWTLFQLKKRDYTIAQLVNISDTDMFELLPLVTYLGACGLTRDLASYDESVFWDHYDEVGINSGDSARVMQLFGESIAGLFIPKEEKKSTVKATKVSK